MSRQPTPSDPPERILQAAAEIFAARGFDGARVDDIAQRARVNKAMVYYHVGDKERLYAAVITGAVNRALASMKEALAGITDPEKRLRTVIRAIGQTATQNPALPPLLLREIASGGSAIPQAVLRKIAKVFQTVGTILIEGHQSGQFRKVDPVITHMVIAGSMFLLVAGTPIRRRVRNLQGMIGAEFNEGSPEELAGQLADLLLVGLRSRRRGGTQ